MGEHESRYSESEGSFDELARGLANGTVSRRRALKLIGGALLGGAFASIPGVALAQRAGGNRSCARFCHQVFSGRQAGECTSAGAHGEGPCFECTPGVGTGPNFTPTKCGAGEIFNPDTCQCEVTCPDTCCCSCTYEDSVTGQQTVVCNSDSTATTPIECHEMCGANVPLGKSLLASGFGCTGDQGPNNRFVCGPVSGPNITGFACFFTTC